MIRPLSKNSRHWVGCIGAEKCQFVLKLYRDRIWFENELLALNVISGRGISLPVVRAAGLRRSHHYLLTDNIEHTAFPTEVDPGTLRGVLTKLYSIRGPTHGLLVDVWNGKGMSSWPLYLETRMASRIGALNNDDAMQVRDVADDLLECLRCAPLEETPRLIHRDLTPANLGIRLDSAPVLFDWEFTSFGDPLYDLSLLWLHSRSRDREPFLEVYSAAVNEPQARQLADFRMRFYRAYLAFGMYVAMRAGWMRATEALTSLAAAEMRHQCLSDLITEGKRLAGAGEC